MKTRPFPPMPALPADARACVAYSGGCDSRALLGLAAEAYGPRRLLALHVNHGIQSAADSIEDFCRLECDRSGIPFMALRVDASHAKGESPEAAAREARYAALATACAGADAAFCLLGHHARDQAETLLLALSRGLGLPGLSGMGDRFERHGSLFLRPLLQCDPASLQTACDLSGWLWRDDPTNADTRFARNLVRAKAIPALSECFPHFERACARSMVHCAQAQQLLGELAESDLAANPRMELARLRRLSDARLSNLLRHWLKSLGAHPSEAQVSEACSQIRASADPSRAIDIKCSHGRLMRAGPFLAFAP